MRSVSLQSMSHNKNHMDRKAQPKHEVHPTDEAVRTATVGNVPLSRLRKIY
jgi:hypothetical protein